MTRRSPSRNAGSPSEAKISGIDMPAASTISWSLSVKPTPSRPASRLPTLVLPAPISPTSTSGRRRRSGAAVAASGSGGSIIAIAVFPRPG